ncbi:MAG: C40 family peptidase [Muribaculaceae bacterium]|nr:C40 family peptidase [Muribaculaceae bacterium]
MTFKTTKHIFRATALAIVMIAGASTINAQRLVTVPTDDDQTSHGTVIEQLNKAAQLSLNDAKVKELLEYAFTFLGTPYRHGAMSPRAFDCSGFTSFVYKKFGFQLDRTSGGQVNDGRRVARAELQPGDLVFFNGRAVNRRIGHVGIVTKVKDNNTFNFIHASCSKGITESNSSESYYARRYMGACRVIE